MSLLADTSAVIDLWRFRRAKHRLTDLTKKIPHDACISHQVVFEFARGGFRRGMTKEAIQTFLSSFQILETTEELIYTASELHGTLQRQGSTVGSGDILIGAAALLHGLPVLTANVKDFARIPDVEIIEYTILP